MINPVFDGRLADMKVWATERMDFPLRMDKTICRRAVAERSLFLTHSRGRGKRMMGKTIIVTNRPTGR